MLKYSIIIFCFVGLLHADVGYIAGDNGIIYTFDPTTGGTAVPFADSIGGSANSVAREGDIGYIGGNDGIVYTFNANNGGAVFPFTMSFGPVIYGIAISGTRGYLAPGTAQEVYTFDTSAPNTTPVLFASSAGGDTPFGIEISGARGYLSAGANKIYTFNADSGGTLNLFATATGPSGSQGVAVSGNTGYLAGDDGTIYTFNATTGGAALPFATSSAIPGVDGISVSGSTGYFTNLFAANVYTFDTAVGGVAQPFTSAVAGIDANGIFLYVPPVVPVVPQVATGDLTGPVLIVANYLNEVEQYLNNLALTFPNFDAVAAFSGNTLQKALESISPARNAFAVYTASITQFFVSNFLQKHVRHHRFRNKQQQQENSHLYAGNFQRSITLSSSSSEGYVPWVEGFGDFVHQKAQEQTPSFTTRGGGAVAALDYYGPHWKRAGLGVAYAYTDLDEGEDAGKASVNQEFVVFYATFKSSRVYCDAALWGGLFQINNERRVSYPGFSAVAYSKPRGWQLTPHLEIGIDRDRSWWCLEPFAMFDWANNWENHVEETGADSWNMGQTSHYGSLLRSEVGVRLYEWRDLDWGHLSFQEKVSYVNKTSFRIGRMTAFLVGQPGSFTIETLSETQNLGVVELEILAVPNNQQHPYISCSYQGEFGRLYRSQQVTFSLGKNF